LNRLATLTDSQTGQFGFSYDALSRRTALTRPNGVNTTYNFDSLSRLASVLHKAGTTTLDGAGYAYDNAGNRTSKTNYLNNVTENYTYDPLYQLTQVTQGLTTTESYAYDPVGNRLSSLGMSPYAYNSSNELTSTPSATFTYDNNGNTTGKADASGTTNYTWDFENRLTAVVLPAASGTVSFKYDPFGRRTQKSLLSATTYLYDGSNSIAELDANGSFVSRYTQGEEVDEPLAEFKGGTSAFYEQDGLSSVTTLSGPAGAVVNSYSYDAFGNLTASTSLLTNPFHYTGRDFDSETGLRYYRARYYDSKFGRFVSEDPIAYDGGINFYSYVGNNPQNFIDPSGKYPIAIPIPIPWWLVGSGTAGGVLAGAGRLAGPVGAAGTVGWGIGRGIGHIPIYGGGTVDDGWQQIFTLLFFSQAASQSQAGPRATCKKNGNADCPRQWIDARAYCAGLMSMSRSSAGWKKYTNIWGGNFDRCVRGQVAERCGGNRVE
jgi:RHS repeat-associated protein